MKNGRFQGLALFNAKKRFHELGARVARVTARGQLKLIWRQKHHHHHPHTQTHIYTHTTRTRATTHTLTHTHLRESPPVRASRGHGFRCAIRPPYLAGALKLEEGSWGWPDLGACSVRVCLLCVLPGSGCALASRCPGRACNGFSMARPTVRGGRLPSPHGIVRRLCFVGRLACSLGRCASRFSVHPPG